MNLNEIYYLNIKGTAVNDSNNRNQELFKKLDVKMLNLKDISQKQVENKHLQKDNFSLRFIKSKTNRNQNCFSDNSKLKDGSSPNFRLDYTKRSINKNTCSTLNAVLSSRLSAFDVNIIREIEKKKPLSVSYY